MGYVCKTLMELTMILVRFILAFTGGHEELSAVLDGSEQVLMELENFYLLLITMEMTLM